MESYIAESQKIHVSRQKPVQPKILGLGPRFHPTDYHIIIDQMSISVGDDLTVTIDRLFKLHYILNLKFDADIIGFFTYLESEVYGIKTSQKLSTRVKELASQVSACKT